MIEPVQPTVGAVISGNSVLGAAVSQARGEQSRGANVSEMSAPEPLADLALTQVESSQEAAAPQLAHDLLRHAQPRRDHAGIGERHEVYLAGRSCWSITATIWLMSGGGRSSGCVGTCTHSTPACTSRSAHSTGRSGFERLSRHLARRERSTQVRIARELVGRCRTLTRTSVEHDRELHARTAALAPRLLQLPGCGPMSAAKLLCEIGPIERFRSDAQLARHAGVAPLDASSGKHQRHRLDRGGNRQLNCAFHRIAITQGRVHPPARAYLERKQSEGKSRREAIRCLKRQLARTIYTTLKAESALT